MRVSDDVLEDARKVHGRYLELINKVLEGNKSV